MAGLAAVETAILTQIATALGMPGGYQANTQAASSVAGVNLRVFRGWPVAALLDTELVGGAGQVSVYPGAGMARVTTRYLGAQADTPSTSTITATIAGQTITLAGTPSAAHLIGIATGRGLVLTTYAYRVLAGNTLAQIATAIAALISGASAVGAVITLTQPIVYARVVADGLSTAEIRRVEQAFRIGLWMPTPDLRDLVADALDGALAVAPFVATAGNEAVRIKYAGTQVFDAPSKDRLWRRDLNFLAEYATTATTGAPPALFVGDNFTGGAGATLALVA
jgi:hypothetical protein